MFFKLLRMLVIFAPCVGTYFLANWAIQHYLLPWLFWNVLKSALSYESRVVLAIMVFYVEVILAANLVDRTLFSKPKQKPQRLQKAT